MTVHSPPIELKYMKKSSAESNQNGTQSSGSGTQAGSIAEVVAGVISGLGYNKGPAVQVANPAPQPSVSAQPTAPAHHSSSPVGIHGGPDILEYLAFLKFRVSEITNIGDILRDQGLFNYRLLNPDDAPREKLEKAGLSTGVISVLYKGVQKYKLWLDSI